MSPVQIEHTAQLFAPRGSEGWRRLFFPPTEHGYPAHRIELSWQNSLAMTILGLVGVIYAVACCATVMLNTEGSHALREHIGFGLGMGFSGTLALFAARTRRGRRHARSLIGLLLLGLSAAAGIGHVQQLSPLVTPAAQVPLLFALTASLVAYRPSQLLLLAVLSLLATTTVTVVVRGFDGLGALVLYSAVIALGVVLFGSFLYQLRWQIIDRRLAMLAEQQLLLQRTSELEEKTERLRQQRSSALDSASTSRARSLSSLAAGVAHEVNNPLGSIRANVDLMQRAVDKLKGRLQEGASVSDRSVVRSLAALEQTLPVTHQATERVAGVVMQLERFARLDRAQLAPIDLRQGLDSAVELLHHKLQGRVEIVRDYDEIPQLMLDGEQIHQVLLNILCNAEQSIEGVGTITLRLRADRQWVTLQIIDTGTGISGELIDRVFDPGFTTRGVGVGTGLGLAISRRVVEAHGGEIELTSKSGQGTTVTIRFSSG